MAIVAALYPPDHPYHWLTIGAAEDITAARIEDVRAFFQTYYRPRNASLSIAGDVQPDEALRLAEDYFGELEAGEEPPPFTCTPPEVRTSESRMVLGGSRRAARGSTSPGTRRRCSRPADAELDLVAEVLASGKTVAPLPHARLRAASRHRSGRVAEFAGGRAAFSRSSRPRPRGARCSSSKRAITERIDRFIQGWTDAVEMERCRAQAESQFVYRLQTVGGFGGKGDQLNAYNVFLGEPDYFDRDLARYREASAAALQRAAAASLRPETRVGPERRAERPHALALEDAQPAVVA
jgi:zinc protease